VRFPGLDVVYILTPPAAHAEQIALAAAAGLPILCEKPLTVTLAEADEAIAAARAAGAPLMTGLSHRYHPLAATVRAMVQSGELGDFVAAWSHRLVRLDVQPGSWLDDVSAGGGLALQYAMHDLDWALTLGGTVAEVNAVLSRTNPALAIEDNLWALLRFARGGSASIGASWSAAQPRVERGVIGSRGNVRIVEQKRLVGALHDGRQIAQNLNDDYDWFDVFVRESRDVIDRVRRGEPFAVTGEDGRRALEISLAALQAAQTERSIALPLAPAGTLEETR
jgi:myo-inositol 2-dehydrogenase/D-chiro-inositol 1-dehydrogenase